MSKFVGGGRGGSFIAARVVALDSVAVDELDSGAVFCHFVCVASAASASAATVHASRALSSALSTMLADFDLASFCVSLAL